MHLRAALIALLFIARPDTPIAGAAEVRAKTMPRIAVLERLAPGSYCLAGFQPGMRESALTR